MPLEDASKILAAFSGGPWFPLVALLYATGLRTGELLALRWSDIDWQRGVVWVRGSLKKSGSQPVFGSRKNDEPYAVAVAETCGSFKPPSELELAEGFEPST